MDPSNRKSCRTVASVGHFFCHVEFTVQLTSSPTTFTSLLRPLTTSLKVCFYCEQIGHCLVYNLSLQSLSSEALQLTNRQRHGLNFWEILTFFYAHPTNFLTKLFNYLTSFITAEVFSSVSFTVQNIASKFDGALCAELMYGTHRTMPRPCKCCAQEQ